MHKPIHGFAALVHPAYKLSAIATNMELLTNHDVYLPIALPIEEHITLLQQVISYDDQRGGTAFATPTCWRRESLVKPLF